MDPQYNQAPLLFAEQLRALQEHRSTCVVKLTDGTLRGEIDLRDGAIVRSHFGALEGQAALDAVLSAGSAVEYVIGTRETPGDEDESMVIPVMPWQAASADSAALNSTTEEDETRQIELTEDAHDHDRQDADDISALDEAGDDQADNADEVADTEQPVRASSPPALPTSTLQASTSTSAFETPKHALRLDESTERVSQPPRTAANTSQLNPRIFFASLALLTLVLAALWPRSKPHSDTAAASDGAASQALGDAAHADPPAVVSAAAAPAAVELESGGAPEAPSGALAPTIPVRVHVGSNGRVLDAELVAARDGFAALEQQALEAARTYRFAPPQQNGKATDVWLTLPVRFRPTPPDHHVRIKGSDSMGASLLPAWAEALQQKQPHLKLEIETLGTTTGLAALLDGSAEVAAASRLVRADELALAERLGMQLREVFAGYDAIAVIVHPENPLTEIDLDSVAKIYAQRVTSWSELGGPDAAIRAVGRPGYSGTHRVFKERVLGRLGPDVAFGAQVAEVEKTADVIAAVAADPAAIGYVSLGLVTPEVRALALASQPGGAGTRPSAAAVRDGSYPLTRPLLLYLRPDSGPAAHELVDFAISAQGQAVVEQHGFVALPPAPPLAATETPGATTPNALTEVIRIYFEPSSALIAADSQPDLRAAVSAVRARRSVVVVGNADSSGTPADNQRLAQRRAEAVATQLREQGSRRATITIEVAAADHPIASNETGEGRRLNRRVDVIVQAQSR